MANVTYTFVAGKKAQASQVNKNFQDCINGINQNASDIAQNSYDISSLQSSKANKNGSGSEVFSVANPTASNQAVNKGYLENAITPVLDYINGLIITKSSNTQIAISAGSCYDTTGKEVLKLTSSYTLNFSSTISSKTTYNIYIRKNKSTNTIDCSYSADDPSGTDYYYRQIGSMVVDLDDDDLPDIISVESLSNSSDKFPSYTNGISFTNESSPYTAVKSGLVVLKGTIGAQNSGGWLRVSINSIEVAYTSGGNSSGGDGYTITLPVEVGDLISWVRTGSSSGETRTLYPLKGV